MPQRKYSVMVVGQGSIGTRHREVLRELGHDVSTVSRRTGEGQFDTIAKAIASAAFDTAVIATETSHHASALAELDRLNYNGTILVEKPLCANAHEIGTIGSSKNIYVGYNLRFMPVVQALREALARDSSAVVSAHFDTAQAFDAWRPGRRPDSVYSAYRSLGGGILRDLSHELDLASWLLGPVDRVSAIGGRYSSQTVDSDDAWSILAKCRNCPQVTISINGIDKIERRFVFITTVTHSYYANLIDGSLSIDGQTQLFPAVRNESYRRMWQAMLGEDGAARDVCTFKEGAGVMQLIAAIEAANELRCWVEPGRHS